MYVFRDDRFSMDNQLPFSALVIFTSPTSSFTQLPVDLSIWWKHRKVCADTLGMFFVVFLSRWFYWWDFMCASSYTGDTVSQHLHNLSPVVILSSFLPCSLSLTCQSFVDVCTGTGHQNSAYQLRRFISSDLCQLQRKVFLMRIEDCLCLWV